MKLLIAAAAFLGALVCAPVQANDAVRNISVTRSASQPSTKGPSQFFTGAVRVDPLFAANAPSRVSGGLVTFEPGARSAWHTHPVGQVLIVTVGRGFVQHWGSPAEEIRPGDVVRIPPGVKHWHGASPSTGMSHIAIQEALDGRNVDWLEHVSDNSTRK
jgi:quercetin dioxygenase-like cupin family protein